MQFFEASYITGENIDNIFYESAKVIAKKIEEGYYEIEDDKEENINFPSNKNKKNCLIV